MKIKSALAARARCCHGLFLGLLPRLEIDSVGHVVHLSVHPNARSFARDANHDLERVARHTLFTARFDERHHNASIAGVAEVLSTTFAFVDEEFRFVDFLRRDFFLESISIGMNHFG